ncbi:hypothetical protein [Lachnoanaerobaculum umeaense]|uniref:Uncharacterized protein n=1 Tax=Lachnoanaerobaculum umeaense TaxID=617123 RepID=A0A385PZ20_9FIRM|nr:hypothetical protein [Lachnoanaerobaculum umeaense]AYA99421.1 hypothetical protein D4A81_05435 [Lachnoanaerobaculum umeaense]PZW99522.1 hypothetical protein C7439_10339 [Lachnoanaerobaculum umeaense]
MKKKILKGLNKVLLVSLIVYLLLSGSIPINTFSATKEDEHITIDISYGYGNIAKGGRYLPIHVFYKNFEDENFSGKVSIEFNEADNRKYAYEYDVNLEGKDSVLSDYYIKISNKVDNIVVVLKDEQQEEIIKKVVSLNMAANQSKIMLGLLSDSQGRLNYFNNVAINFGLLSLNTVNLSAGSFPKSSSGLEQLDIIIISDFRIRDLSNEQSRALMDWVKQGGVLMIGTGTRADDTIGRYAPELLEDIYETPSIRTVNFLLNNEIKSVDLDSTYINLHGGNVIVSDDEFPLITSVNKQKGIIAVAGFDFCDLNQFAIENTQFARYIISNILGNERIEAFSNQSETLDDTFQNIEPILNSSEIKKLPPMTIYTLVFIAYILLIGPILFIYLRDCGLAIYYRKIVVLISLLLLAMIIIYNGRTRFSTTFYNYVTVYEAGDSDVSETTYVNLRNPYNKPYNVVIDSNYSIVPIIRNKTNIDERRALEKNTSVNIDNAELIKDISIKNVGAFSSNIWKMDKTIENLNNEGFSGDINFFDGNLSVEITNNYKHKVKNTTLLLYGKIAMLGDFDAGETKTIESCEFLNIPLTNFDITAKLITGMEEVSTINQNGSVNGMDTEQYMQRLNVSNFLSFYMMENSNGYTADARIIAFSDTALSSPIFYSDTMEGSGLTLLTSVIPVNSIADGVVYRQSLLKMPLILSGDYSYIDNALKSNQATVLEYFLGDDINIGEVKFEQISEVFSNPQYSDRLKTFNGNIALYNFKTGNFDYVSKNEFSLLELLTYLSDNNTMRVRYSNIENGDLETALPMISVLGVEK